MTLLIDFPSLFSCRTCGLKIKSLFSIVTGGGITIEVQKWKSGYYSLLYDENQSSETEGLDMYLFFNVEGVYQGLFETGGTVLYSPATEDEEVRNVSKD